MNSTNISHHLILYVGYSEGDWYCHFFSQLLFCRFFNEFLILELLLPKWCSLKIVLPRFKIYKKAIYSLAESLKNNLEKVLSLLAASWLTDELLNKCFSFFCLLLRISIWLNVETLFCVLYCFVIHSTQVVLE